MNRRQFIKLSLGGFGLALFNELSPPARSLAANLDAGGCREKPKYIPPIFCMAWIDPTVDSQKGQESMAARFPLALVTQDKRNSSKRWKDDVREINPEIIFLAYQMVIEETTVPGPGHDVMRRISDAWVRYPTGVVPHVLVHGHKKRRIFDSRNPSWQRAFIEACDATLSSYDYDGLFLDQCAIFSHSELDATERLEMRVALQDVLLKVRKKWPGKILVANSRDNWRGLNGEMNENRSTDYHRELVGFEGHSEPNLDMACIYLKDNTPMAFVEKKMWEVVDRGAMFAACENPQHIRWFDFYDRLIEGHINGTLTGTGLFENRYAVPGG